MSARNQSFRTSLPAYEPPAPRVVAPVPVGALLIGAALGVPAWWGLYALAAWAHGVLGWGRP